MPCVVAFSCCASDCAAVTAEICADALPEVVDSDCSARREIRKGGFERAGVAGRSVDGLQLRQDARDLVGVGAAGRFGAQLGLYELIELAA